MISYPNVKINLGLNVLRKRPDGYHDLETLFFPSHAFHDTLEVIPADAYSETSASLFQRYGESQTAQAITEDGKLMITVAKAGGVSWDPLKDLTVKAYKLMAEDYALPPVKIFLEKTNPVGAGLGGGSSDAAFALRSISQISGLSLTDSVLASYAARLGSDCAFFLYDRPMIGEGRGEILTPYDIDLSAYELRITVPQDVSVSTAEAYAGITPRNLQPQSGLLPLREALSSPVGEWTRVLVNDFETTVFARHPELAAIKQSFYDEGAVYASMSGSGSAVFALFEK